MRPRRWASSIRRLPTSAVRGLEIVDHEVERRDRAAAARLIGRSRIGGSRRAARGPRVRIALDLAHAEASRTSLAGRAGDVPDRVTDPCSRSSVVHGRDVRARVRFRAGTRTDVRYADSPMASVDARPRATHVRFGRPRVDGFHPAVGTWFRRRFPDGPTPPQRDGWPRIAAGDDTLIAAPTGSGKTLAAFLMCINRLYLAHEAGDPIARHRPRRVRVAVEGARGRHRREPPATAPGDRRGRRGARVSTRPTSTVAVRTGDTPSSRTGADGAQAAELRRSRRRSRCTCWSRARAAAHALRTIDTVIVDEIHAVARDKRGAHLALTLERLEALCDAPPDPRRPVGDAAADRDRCPAARRRSADARHHRQRPPARARPRHRAARG